MRAMVLAAILIPSLALAQAALPTDEAGLLEMVKKNPKAGRAWLALGTLRQKAGKLDGAIEAYQQAEGLGMVPIAAYNLATAKSLKGDVPGAYASLEKSFGAGFALYEDMLADPDLAKARAAPGWEEERKKLESMAYPCANNPINRQLDFWVGEWDVFAPQGYQVGQSSVQRILGGCVVFENWSGRLGGHGKSFNFFDASKGKWQQSYVDDKGTVLEITGALKGNAMVYEGEVLIGKGQKRQQRLSFTPMEGGAVRQLWEQSDDGKTWTTLFDGIYRKKPA